MASREGFLDSQGAVTTSCADDKDMHVEGVGCRIIVLAERSICYDERKTERCLCLCLRLSGDLMIIIYGNNSRRVIALF